MRRDVVVIGASAGGVEAIGEVLSALPPDLDAAVFIVLHIPPTASTFLPVVLQRHCSLRTEAAADGERIQAGRVYVAQPDHHLTLRDGSIRLDRGPKENGHRPSVDTLFRSAAAAFGDRVVGVVLSGSLDDGAMGSRVIALAGGQVLVQDPTDASFPGMPQSAIEAVPAALIATARDIGKIVAELAQSSVRPTENAPMPDESAANPHIGLPDPTQTSHEGTPSVFTCPECHGTLFLVDEGDLERFRCRVGHGYSADSLLAGQSEALEAALWAALRALEERNDLASRMAARANKLGQPKAAARFEARLRDGQTNVELLRQVLLSGETQRDEVS